MHSLPASERRACTVSRCSVEQLTKAWAAGGQLRADGCQLTLQPDISLASLLVKLTLLGLGLAIGPQTLSSQGRDGLELASRYAGDSLQYSAAGAEVSYQLNRSSSQSMYSECQLRWRDIAAHEHRLVHARRCCLRSVPYLKLADGRRPTAHSTPPHPRRIQCHQNKTFCKSAKVENKSELPVSSRSGSLVVVRESLPVTVSSRRDL